MKHLSLLLVIVMLLSMTACSQSDTNTDNSTNSSSKTESSKGCSHDWLSATCTAPKTCTICNETIGTALGHTTDSGVCSRCGENFSAWEISEYTDEFNMPTSEKYIISIDLYGTFSNSATTNSKLYAALQIDKSDIGIMLWEYGSHLVKGTFDSESYPITILDSSGAKHSFTGTIYKSDTRVYFRSADRERVLNLLRNNNKLSIYLKSSKYSISTYLFEIDTKGFNEAYKQISGSSV